MRLSRQFRGKQYGVNQLSQHPQNPRPRRKPAQVTGARRDDDLASVSTASVRVFPRGSKNQGTDEVQDVNFDRFSMAPEMLLFRPPLATLATRWFAGLEASDDGSTCEALESKEM
eukprot:symbB.v1.2.018230.t1/scaffold1448.1/size118061/6